MPKPSVDAAFVRSILLYNPETGVFVWRQRSDVPKYWNTRYAGKKAGYVWTMPDGRKYRSIRILDYPFQSHVIAWVYMTGHWPQHLIDHADNDGTNNIWANLRPANKAQNAANAKRPVTNTSGFKGVSRHKSSGKWRATIRIEGKQVHLGHFSTKEEAHAAYVAKARQVHGRFARAA